MTNEIKEFIEKHIDLIEAEEFKKLYDLTRAKITSREDPSFTGEFTETLLSAGIDPAKYMKEIPSHYLEQSSIQSYVVPHGVTSIGAFAFLNCKGLTDVGIPNSVTFISSCVFENCSGLTNIVIPENITFISDSTFSGCSSLTSIIIPDDVTSICSFAFHECSGLTRVTIGNKVNIIDFKAFSNCINLKSINYLGTKDQWAEVNLDDHWKTGSHRLKEIKCKDGVIDLNNK
jgi:hypothetical protein